MLMYRILLTFCLLIGCAVGSRAGVVALHTPHTSLVLSAPKGGALQWLYYGSQLTAIDLSGITALGGTVAYPVFGLGTSSAEAALAVTHSDGNYTTDLLVADAAQMVQEAHSTLARIPLRDPVYDLCVDYCVRAYTDCDVVEVWTEIWHNEPSAVTLRRYCSAVLPVRRSAVWVSHLHGSWAAEAQMTQQPLQDGVLEIRNKDGVRNGMQDRAEVMFSLDGTPEENSGRTIAAALCYSGNYQLRIVTNWSDYHRLFAGIMAEDAPYTLPSGERFVTPKLAVAYSDEGCSGASRALHAWGRQHQLAHGTALRDVLLNSWEGVYMDITEQAMETMMRDLAELGGELFVMDDGWFGRKYPRTNSQGLGDWQVDTHKLPHGIAGLTQTAARYGVKFGLWIEPEMACLRSALCEAHPEWVLRAPRREVTTGRGSTQVVLDMANPEVQDYVFSIVDTLLTTYPDIAYIKWDANMEMQDYGSGYLADTLQGHTAIAYHKGLERVWQRVRSKYPDVVLQACGSGGGRINWGVLPYFDECWVSDNTDALQRIYTQWGTSYFYPAVAMASHISASPNHQTGRVIPMKYRIDVAMSGRLGIEMQPRQMTAAERALCAEAIADYKRIRPTVQQGDLYRLISPYAHQGVALLMYVGGDKAEAVAFWWQLDTFCGQHLPRLRMAGLNPDRHYRVTELHRRAAQPLAVEGKCYSGRMLMESGIEVPAGHNGEQAWASTVLLLTAVD